MELLLRMMIFAGLHPAVGAGLHATPRPDLDEIFIPQESGWLGADSAASIRLDEATHLWLWGDTLVGHSKSRLRTPGWRMPHQSLALMSGDHEPHYVIPSGGSLAACGASCFFWFVGGVVGADTGSLFVQAWNISAAKWLGNVIAVVHRPSPERINDWSYAQVTLPVNTSCTLSCGMANGLGGRLLLLGNCGQHAILARVKETDLATKSVDSLEFWTEGGWSSENSRAAPLFESQGFSESSLHHYPSLGLWVAPVLQNGHPTIQLATAPAVTGPWSVTDVYSIPSTWGAAQNRSHYAAKAHPELSSGGRSVVISFNTNSALGPSNDPFRLRDANHGLLNTSVYRPRFVEVHMPTPVVVKG